ncbi:MAG: hypothetical protein LBM98_12180 [Oscillospiraceae bacterium]|nr:hypothetical protein [Oscillospiraceae bacterium]
MSAHGAGKPPPACGRTPPQRGWGKDVGCALRGACVNVTLVQTLVQTLVLIPSVEGCRRNGGVVSPPQRTQPPSKLHVSDI